MTMTFTDQQHPGREPNQPKSKSKLDPRRRCLRDGTSETLIALDAILSSLLPPLPPAPAPPPTLALRCAAHDRHMRYCCRTAAADEALASMPTSPNGHVSSTKRIHPCRPSNRRLLLPYTSNFRSPGVIEPARLQAAKHRRQSTPRSGVSERMRGCCLGCSDVVCKRSPCQASTCQTIDV